MSEGELQKLIRQYSGSVTINPKALLEMSNEERYTFAHLYVLEMDALKFIEDAKRDIFSAWFERKSPEDIQNTLSKWFGSQ